MPTLLTYRNLQDRVLRWIDEAQATSTTTTALVADAVNASHRRLITAKQWPFMAWPQVESITTVSGTRVYALNPNSNRIFHLWDTLLRQYVPVVPRREWPGVGANQSNTDTPPYGVTWGPMWPVQRQPTTTDVLVVNSSSAADTGVMVRITGVNEVGDIVAETVTMNGTSAVATTNQYVRVTNLTKIDGASSLWAGTLTVLADGQGTTLVTLGHTEPGRQYPTIEFLEGPTAGRTYTYEFQRLPNTLVYDGDIPETPYPYSEIHVYDALLDLTTYNTELGAKEQVLWKKRYDELMDGLLNAWDEQIVGSYPRFTRDLDDKTPWSRVGAWNP